MDKKLTLQDIFNAAWQRFIVEMKPAGKHDELTCCEYITEEGKMCAVGCALPAELLDEILAAALNQQPFNKIVDMYPEYFEDSVHYYSKYELEAFQRSLHDGIFEMMGREECRIDLMMQYLKVAKAYNLKIPRFS